MLKNGFRIFWRRSTTRSACTRLWGIVLPMSMSELGRGGTLLSTQNEIVVYRAFTKAVFERNSNRKRKIPKNRHSNLSLPHCPNDGGHSILLFEKLINVVHKHAPQAKLCFNTLPSDTAAAVKRWL